MQRFITRVLKKMRLLSYMNLKVAKKINDSKFSVPILGGIGYNNLFDWEPWMMDILEIISDDKDALFIDVGANIGQTLLKVKSQNPTSNYLGFEPNPTCLYYLRNLIKANAFQNVNIAPVAISEKTGIETIEFYNQESTDGSASIVKNFRPKNTIHDTFNVAAFNMTYLDLSCFEQNVEAIKIDVEGSELAVVKGFYNLIKIHKPYILIEILPIYNEKLKERHENQVEIEEILRELGYSKFRVFPDKGNIELRLIEEIGVHSDINHCDYVLVPESRLSKFKQKCIAKTNIQVTEEL